MKKEEENSPPAQRLKGKSGKWKVGTLSTQRIIGKPIRQGNN